MATPTLRSETAGLVRYAEGDLAALWRLVAEGASAEVALRDLLPAIVTTYGQAGAALAADWYEQQRAKFGVKRRFAAEPIVADDRGAQNLIGYALDVATDDLALRTLIAGGVQRRIADHVRLTVTEASISDPGAQGWVRVGVGECDWCQQYLDGEVRAVAYDFPAHDGCGCTAVPAW